MHTSVCTGHSSELCLNQGGHQEQNGSKSHVCDTLAVLTPFPVTVVAINSTRGDVRACHTLKFTHYFEGINTKRCHQSRTLLKAKSTTVFSATARTFQPERRKAWAVRSRRSQPVIMSARFAEIVMGPAGSG